MHVSAEAGLSVVNVRYSALPIGTSMTWLAPVACAMAVDPEAIENRSRYLKSSSTR